MTVMRRMRPVWAVVAAACAVVVAASVVGSVATGIGWEWSRTRTTAGSVSGVAVARGGVHWHDASAVPTLGGIPIVGNFFTIRVESPGWWFRWSTQPKSKEVVVPLWALGVFAGGVMVFAWRRATRVEKGHCARCGYDLKGLAAGAVCPECGAAQGGGGQLEGGSGSD